MNFDELQSAWNHDKGGDIQLPENLQRLKSARLPMDRIKHNMRTEFFMTLVVYLLMGLFPLLSWRGVPPVPFYAMFIAIIILTVFHYIKFYLFYRRLDTNALSSKDNLYEVYYDIKLNIELYKSFNYSITPLMMLYLVMVFMNLEHLTATPLTQHRKMVILISLAILFIIVIVLVVVLVERWANYFYGKYLKQVGRLLDELRET